MVKNRDGKKNNNSTQVRVKEYISKELLRPNEKIIVKNSVEMKEYISKLSLDILSKSSDQNKKLKELYSILEDKDHGKSIILRKSIIVSLCLIYKDILPSYKISLLTELQKEQSMKKDTVKLYSEEELLLINYQKYIRLIESVLLKKFNIESINFIKWTESDELTLLKCACKLYLCRPNFNHSQTLLSLIVPFLNTTNTKLLKASSSAIEGAISEDLKGDVTLKICEEVKKVATKKKFVFRSTLLKPLIVIELEDMDLPESNTNSFKKRNTFSRTQKKSFKKNKKSNDEQNEINAKESLDSKFKYNSQIIRTLFYVYFQALKQRNISSKLLEVILESIQRYGRLIDCKMFPDTFKILTNICDNTNISIDNRLRSVYVALCILTSGKASEILEIDPVNFSHKLLTIGNKGNLNENSVLLVINCCTKILMKRRNQNSMKDVERIIKMLISLAWNLKTVTHLSALIILSTVRYMRVYPRLQFMFDDEDDEMPEAFKEKTVESNKGKVNAADNITFSHIRDLCNVKCYEISGVAKRIKKFFMKSEGENSLVGLKSSLEELTKLTNDECLETLKLRCQKVVKRKADDDNSEIIKKAKLDLE